MPNQSTLAKSVIVTGDRTGRTTPDLPITPLRQSAKRLRAVSLFVPGIMIVSWMGMNLIEGEFLDEFTQPVVSPPTSYEQDASPP